MGGVGERRVVLLRGINVGGHRKILMADLRELMTDLGFGDVATYIQSGNVTFSGGLAAALEIEAAVRVGIADRFGFEVPVMMRTRGELVHAAKESRDLFSGSDDGEVAHAKKVHVVFLSSRPPRGSIDRLDPQTYPNERFALDGRELHVRYGQGAAKSKLSLAIVERVLDVRASARNLATVQKLIELSGE